MNGLNPDLRFLVETHLMLLKSVLQLDNSVKLLHEQIARLQRLHSPDEHDVDAMYKRREQ